MDYGKKKCIILKDLILKKYYNIEYYIYYFFFTINVYVIYSTSLIVYARLLLHHYNMEIFTVNRYK